ncbi:hypothetical protein Tco_0194165 [Tanacetum coccineum]
MNVKCLMMMIVIVSFWRKDSDVVDLKGDSDVVYLIDDSSKTKSVRRKLVYQADPDDDDFVDESSKLKNFECGEHFMSFFLAPLVPFSTSVELFSLRKLSTRRLLQIGKKLASEEDEASVEKDKYLNNVDEEHEMLEKDRDLLLESMLNKIVNVYNSIFGSTDLLQPAGLVHVSDSDRLRSFIDSYALGTRVIKDLDGLMCSSFKSKLNPEHVLRLVYGSMIQISVASHHQRIALQLLQGTLPIDSNVSLLSKMVDPVIKCLLGLNTTFGTLNKPEFTRCTILAHFLSDSPLPDRLERTSSYGNDGEKIQAASLRNVHAYPLRLIGLQGCCSSEAYQLLNNRVCNKIGFVGFQFKVALLRPANDAGRTVREGQTLSKVGLLSQRPVFSHEKLYVVVSKVKSMKSLKILCSDRDDDDEDDDEEEDDDDDDNDEDDDDDDDDDDDLKHKILDYNVIQNF